MAIEHTVEKRDDRYYKVTKYYTSHTGVVGIRVEDGQMVEEGDTLYTLTRLDLIKRRLSDVNGTVRSINHKLENEFSGYYTHVLDVEHELSPEEVQVLEEEKEYTFVYAPQGAQYYVTNNPGMPPLASVGEIVQKGKVIAVAMVMKKRREVVYQGERGRIAKIYFMNGQQVHQGDKLFGILPRPIKSRTN
jgi:biotin carboxyl carrier protein